MRARVKNLNDPTAKQRTPREEFINETRPHRFYPRIGYQPFTAVKIRPIFPRSRPYSIRFVFFVATRYFAI